MAVNPVPEEQPVTITADRLKEAEKYIEEEEGVTRRLSGFFDTFITVVAVVMSLYHLYAAVTTVTTQVLRGIHVAFVLFLGFLVFPPHRKSKQRLAWYDVLLALLGVATIGYMLFDFEEFIYRAVTPTFWDLAFGLVFILLILEVARRATGLIMPFICLLFLIYAYSGPVLPAPWTHRGYDLERIVGHMYMTLEGIFGTPIDVSSTFIILFTIYGAMLEYSGAGKFFIDFSFAAMGKKPTAAGRTVTLASFLLGGPSGSGVATTVTLGSVAYPMLARAGYDKNSAGGLLSAGGIGAIISPPVLGAAAFLIAEILKISYLEVLRMAVMPTLLYYLSIFLMVEFDAKKFGARQVVIDESLGLKALTARYWFHFTSLIAIVVLMLVGFTPILGVFLATLMAVGVSFLRSETALKPKKADRGPPFRLHRRFGRGRHLRQRRHHRGRGYLNRPGSQIQFHRHLLCRGQPLSDLRLHRVPDVDHRPGRSGYGLLHHRGGDRRAGLDYAQGAGFRGPYVYLLLRGPFRGFSPDRPFAFCRGGPDRRGPLQDHHDGLEIHPAGLYRSFYVYPSSGRGGIAAGRVLAQDYLDFHHFHDRHSRPGRGGGRLVPATGQRAGTNPVDHRRFDAGVFLLAV